MGKILKRTLSLCISMVLVATMFVATTFTTASAADANFIIADACDDLYAWTLQMGGGELSIDKNDYKQGDGSVFIDMPIDEDGLITSAPFAMMMFVNLEAPVDTVANPYCEIFIKLSLPDGQLQLPSKSGFQVNLVDLDVGGADGINANLGIDYSATGWHRLKYDSSTIPLASAAIPTDRTNISALRLSWLCYSDEYVYYECDWNFDGLMFYNQEFLDARTAEETRVFDLVAGLEIPTAETYVAAKDGILAVADAVELAKVNYPNFMIENQSNLDSVLSAYYSFVMPEQIAATEALIDAIGEVTEVTYLDTLTAIEAAEVAVAQLNEYYGEAAVVSNIDTLTAARESYDGFVVITADKEAAQTVIDAINALPVAENLAVEDEAAVVDARTGYDALTEAQKLYVSGEVRGILEADEAQMYILLHPYKLGDVDENDAVTSADALLALQHAVSKITLVGNKFLAADVDGTGTVTATDALCILQYSVNKITEWPINK